jgi:hypothetical protein
VHTQVCRYWDALGFDFMRRHFMVTTSGDGFNHVHRLGLRFAIALATHWILLRGLKPAAEYALFEWLMFERLRPQAKATLE